MSGETYESLKAVQFTVPTAQEQEQAVGFLHP
jgi:hypothetical protein